MTTRIIFVRHGEVHNPQQVVYARLPGFRISDEGQSQARAAGEALAGEKLAAIYSSPMQRAQETAGWVARPHGMSIITNDLINETYTPYEGRPRAELEATGWDLYSGVTAPYELPVDIVRRVQQFVGHVRQQHAGQTVVAVSHGDILLFAAAWAHGLPLLNRPSDSEIRGMGISDGYPAYACLLTATLSEVDDTIASVSYRRPY